MAEQAELFRILDNGSGAGEAPRSKSEGDAPSTDKGIIGFAFKDSTGNVVLPQLDSDGKLPVSSAAPGTTIRDSGTATPAAVVTDTDDITITLTANESYKLCSFGVSSAQPSVWRIEHNNNGTPDELARVFTGPGDFNYSDAPQGCEFTAGATGTQELKIIMQQLRGPVSDAHAYVCALQKA